MPFGTTPFTRDYDVDAIFALGMLRLGGTGAELDVGAGVAFFDSPAVLLSLAAGVRVTERIALKARADGLLLSQPTLPIGFGISYALGS